MILGQPQARRRRTPVTAASPQVPGARPGVIIPYDYAAAFKFTGRRGNLLQDVITISPEGAFVAVAIGYGFEEERAREMQITPPSGPTPPPLVKPGDITLAQVPQQALIEGFRVNPRFESMVFGAENGGVRKEKELSDQEVPQALAGKQLFQRLRPPESISFLFSILDSATGRELQDEPIHNLASLGISNGERPFRLLAQPLSFLPRSTVRLQVIERSEEVEGTLFIVLYGYKVVGGAGCPEPLARTLLESATRPAATGGVFSERVVPFDYVTRFELTGTRGNRLEDEITVNIEGGFVATALGYGLLVEERDAPIRLAASTSGTFDLSQQPLRALPASALGDGIRVRPSYLRMAFDNSGGLATSLPVYLGDKIFERLNRPEDVLFRYMIFDAGTGRDWQNRPINNIAGLGIANGQRPFKKFARPMVFPPRSTVRVEVEERSGRGTLFLVFQGYKVLEAPMAGGRP